MAMLVITRGYLLLRDHKLKIDLASGNQRWLFQPEKSSIGYLPLGLITGG